MQNDNAHLDIFSGIGGFAIAARDAGFETIAFCESDSGCREFLGRTWGLPVKPDIRKLDGRKYRGISLLTGGPPCQPASRAGKQGGEGDDRWLWPEALRVLDEAKPDCVVFENPPGILDVGIDGILSEMERIGYESQPFDIPACAVDSPQLRHRIWIVGFLADATKRGQRANWSASRQTGHIDERGQDVARSLRGRPEATPQRNREAEQGPADGNSRRADVDRRSEHMADTAEPGRERRDAERASNGCRPQRPQILVADSTGARQNGEAWEEQHILGRPLLPARSGDSERSAWQNAIWVPCADGKLRRAPDDSFDLVDGLHRSLLGALGNSICPQVATQILIACRGLIQ